MRLFENKQFLVSCWFELRSVSKNNHAIIDVSFGKNCNVKLQLTEVLALSR